MPAKPVSINLLGDQDLQHTPFGRLISWAVTYGRYIMIGTEIIVLLAFISRFSLDRKKVDLDDEIKNKKYILDANENFEKSLIALNDRLTIVTNLTKNQSSYYDTLVFIRSVMPSDVLLQSINISNLDMNLSATAGTTEGFSIFISKLKSSTLFNDIDLGEVKKSSLSGITFTLRATFIKNTNNF